METNRIKQREAFVDAYLSGHWSMSELCEHFGVSRPTGYVWVARFDPHDQKCFHDRSRAPRHHGNQTDPQTTAWVVLFGLNTHYLFGSRLFYTLIVPGGTQGLIAPSPRVLLLGLEPGVAGVEPVM